MESETATSYRCNERRGLTATNVTSLFQPDTVLSTQFFDDRRRKTLLEAEKRLMLAILDNAVHCFQDHHLAQHGKRKRLFDDVHRWFFEASSDWLCGFENICSVLGLNPEYIRKGLVRSRTKELSKHRRAPFWEETKKSQSLEFRCSASDEQAAAGAVTGGKLLYTRFYSQRISKTQ
jgi:hypothetical protein